MAKSMQVNIGGAMKKVKAIYINIGGTLHKVKKGVVNIGNSIKEFFSSELKFVTKFSTTLGAGAYNCVGTGVGDYLMFVEMQTGSSVSSGKVYCISIYNYTTTNPSSGASPAMEGKAAKLLKSDVGDGGYAFFVGGETRGSFYYDTVDCYDENLVKLSDVTALPNPASYAACCSFENNLLIAGGKQRSNTYSTTAFVYKQNLTQTLLSDINDTSYKSAAVATGNYCIVATNTTLDAYNNNFVKTSVSQTLTGGMRQNMGTMTINNIAVFAGGSNVNSDTTAKSTVDFYNSSLVRLTSANLDSVGIKFSPGTGVTIKENGVLLGGATSNWNQRIATYIISQDLTITVDTTTYSACKYGANAQSQDGLIGGFYGGKTSTNSNSKTLGIFTLE